MQSKKARQRQQKQQPQPPAPALAPPKPPSKIYLCFTYNPLQEYKWGEEPDIIFSVGYDFYCIDLKNTKPGSTLSPVFNHPATDIGRLAHWCTLGCNLYILGGHVNDTKLGERVPRANVRVLDTKHPDQGWVDCAPMDGPRDQFQAVGLLGKVYVFGSPTPIGYAQIPSDAPNRWGEVYDPVKDKWAPLPSPGLSYFEFPPKLPRNALQTRNHFVAHKLNKVAVFFIDGVGIHYFNLTNGRWEVSKVPGQLTSMWGGRHVVVDNILYAVINDGSQLVACDLTKDFPSFVNIRGLAEDHTCPPRDPRVPTHTRLEDPYRYLFHLGGNNFCMLWDDPYPFDAQHAHDFLAADISPDSDPRYNFFHIIYCLKFHITNSTAHFDSRDCYFARGVTLQSCFCMDDDFD